MPDPMLEGLWGLEEEEGDRSIREPSLPGERDGDLRGVDASRKTRRHKGRGLSDVLGLDLFKEFEPPLITSVLTTSQQSKFVLVDDVDNDAMMNIDVILRNRDYGAPGLTKFRKNMQVAPAARLQKFEEQNTR